MDVINAALYVIGIIGLGATINWCYEQIFYWKKRGIPAAPVFPFLGSYMPLVSKTLPLALFQKYIYDQNADSRYIGFMDFNTPCIMLKDPELIKEVSIKNAKSFPEHKTWTDEETDPLFGGMLFFLDENRSKEIRCAMSPVFTPSKLKIAFDHMSKIAKRMVKYLLEHPDETSSIEMKDLFTRYAGDVVGSVGYGINVDSMANKNNDFFLQGRAATRLNATKMFFVMLLFRISPWLQRITGASIVSRKLFRFFRNLTKELLIREEKSNTVNPNIIHYMNKAKGKEYGKHMTIDHITAQGFNYFFGGLDTVSDLMSFLAYELTVNPEIQDRLRNEIDSTLLDDTISIDSLKSMKYLDAVVSEALRKHPPIVFTDRVCREDFELPPTLPGGRTYTVRANMTILLPIYSLHRDPKYFPEPEKFNPERFMEENRSMIVPYSYLPFGAGPRNCIGYSYAWMEIKLALSYILKHFILKPTERTAKTVTYDTNSLTMTMKGGCWINMVPRH